MTSSFGTFHLNLQLAFLNLHLSLIYEDHVTLEGFFTKILQIKPQRLTTLLPSFDRVLQVFASEILMYLKSATGLSSTLASI